MRSRSCGVDTVGRPGRRDGPAFGISNSGPPLCPIGGGGDDSGGNSFLDMATSRARPRVVVSKFGAFGYPHQILGGHGDGTERAAERKIRVE
jgi:hypothetical protein